MVGISRSAERLEGQKAVLAFFSLVGSSVVLRGLSVRHSCCLHDDKEKVCYVFAEVPIYNDADEHSWIFASSSSPLPVRSIADADDAAMSPTKNWFARWLTTTVLRVE